MFFGARGGLEGHEELGMVLMAMQKEQMKHVLPDSFCASNSQNRHEAVKCNNLSIMSAVPGLGHNRCS